jgi:hypothetical protein
MSGMSGFGKGTSTAESASANGFNQTTSGDQKRSMAFAS